MATGYTDLDQLLSGLQPSTLNVVGARPSMGKCVAGDTLILDPATGELVTAAELHRRGQAGQWVQVAALDNGGRLRVVPSPSAFVADGHKPVYRVRTGLGRVVRTTGAPTPSSPRQGWKPLAHPGPRGRGWRCPGGCRSSAPTRCPGRPSSCCPGPRARRCRIAD